MSLAIAHRGASGTAPENTLAAFRRAVDLGADAVELDVHRTADGHLVVIHEPVLEATTTGRGAVRDLTLAEVKAADAGVRFSAAFAGERVPTLYEVVEALPHPTRLFIELKAGSLHYPGIEEQLLALLSETGARARAQISSFDHHALHRLRQLDRAVATGALIACNPGDPVALARWAGATALHPVWYWVRPELIRACRAVGLAVYTWTVNDPQQIEQLRRLGVDGIMSDYPERL